MIMWIIDIVDKDGKKFACTSMMNKKNVEETLPQFLKFACFGNGEFELRIKPVENG